MAKKEYREVVAAEGRVEVGDGEYLFLTGPSGFGVGEEKEFPAIKEGYFVEVIYRYAKKPWGGKK